MTLVTPFPLLIVGGLRYNNGMTTTQTVDETLVNSATIAYLEQFQASNTRTIYAGSVWYSQEQQLVKELAVIHDLPIEVVASVVASFSPRNRWVHNVFLATEFLAGNPVATLGNNIKMAQKSLVKGFDALKGQKTNAFARNLAGDLTAVTIDTWMIKAAGLDNRKGVNRTQYNSLSVAITNVANMYAIPPAVMQAIIWVQIRGAAK